MIQMANLIVGEDISNGNMASRWLQELGSTIADGHENYTTKAFRDQMENNAWNIKTAMHPDFWSNPVAEGIPMLVEMVLLSKGMSGVAKKGSKYALKGIAKSKGRDIVEDVTGKVIRGGGKGVMAEQTALQALKNPISAVVTKSGDLTKLGSGIADFIGGGVTQNMLAGLMNAAEMVNTLKQDGEFTEEELARMASASFTNNMAYLPIDLLSWGFTYGEGGKLISRQVQKLVGGSRGAINTGKMLNSSQSLKQSALMFTNATKPIYSKFANKVLAVAKAVPEGFEETFQETFEEWSKKKAQAKVSGDDMEYDSYMDFYLSKENEATRAVSMALGMFGGSGAQILGMTNHIDKEAERAFKMYDKTELLKNIISNNDPKMKEAQTQAIHEMIINNKYHGDIDNYAFVQDLMDKGVISEEESTAVMEKVSAIEETWANAEKVGLNVNGKVAYATSVMEQEHKMNHLKNIETKYNEKVALLKEKIAVPEDLEKKIAEATKIYEKQKLIVDDNIAYESAVQQSLLSKGGKVNLTQSRSTHSRWVVDENGNDIILDGLTTEKYNEFYKLTDEEIFKAIEENQNKDRGGVLGWLGRTFRCKR